MSLTLPPAEAAMLPAHLWVVSPPCGSATAQSGVFKRPKDCGLSFEAGLGKFKLGTAISS